MTYDKWAYFIRDRISRLKNELYIDIREVKQAMGTAFEQLIFETDPKNMDGMYDYYAKEYLQATISLNSTTQRYEAEYPVSVIMTPGARKMLQQTVRVANYLAGEAYNMTPITERAYYRYAGQGGLLTDESNALRIDDTIRYIVLNDRIVFVAGVSSGDAILTNGIRIKLVPKLENYDDDDEIIIPDNRAIDFEMYVLEQLGVTPPVNLKDDK